MQRWKMTQTAKHIKPKDSDQQENAFNHNFIYISHSNISWSDRYSMILIMKVICSVQVGKYKQMLQSSFVGVTSSRFWNTLLDVLN